jgi:hypothetical protein
MQDSSRLGRFVRRILACCSVIAHCGVRRRGCHTCRLHLLDGCRQRGKRSGNCGPASTFWRSRTCWRSRDTRIGCSWCGALRRRPWNRRGLRARRCRIRCRLRCRGAPEWACACGAIAGSAVCCCSAGGAGSSLPPGNTDERASTAGFSRIGGGSRDAAFGGLAPLSLSPS